MGALPSLVVSENRSIIAALDFIYTVHYGQLIYSSLSLALAGACRTKHPFAPMVWLTGIMV